MAKGKRKGKTAEQVKTRRVRAKSEPESPETLAEATAEAEPEPIRYNTCVSCGRQFPHPGGHPRMFGCACCALALDVNHANRDVGMRTKVVLCEEGRSGVVVGIHAKGEYAVVRRDEGNEDVEVTLGQMEKIHFLKVKHYSNCDHNPASTMDALKAQRLASIARARAAIGAKGLKRQPREDED